MLPSIRSATLAIWKSDPSITVEARSAALSLLEGKAKPDTAFTVDDCILKPAAVARLLSVTARSVHNMAAQGILTKVRLPGRRLCSGYRKSDVIALIENRTAAVVEA